MVAYIFYKDEYTGDVWSHCYTTQIAFERDCIAYDKKGITFLALAGPDIHLCANKGLVKDFIEFNQYVRD